MYQFVPEAQCVIGVVKIRHVQRRRLVTEETDQVVRAEYAIIANVIAIPIVGGAGR